MSKGKFALGALFGAAAGIVAGMLTAPKAGKETRADLKEKADELKARAEKAKARGKVKAAELREKAEDEKKK